MKIASIRATAVNVPIKGVIATPLGRRRGCSRTNVEVPGDDGLAGLGVAHAGAMQATIFEC